MKEIKFIKYSEQEKDILRRYYPKTGTEGVLKMFRIKGLPLRTRASIKSACMRLGIKTATAGRFQAGHIPVNKGQKMTDDVLQKVKPTCFKPGHLGVNTMPIGSMRKTKDGYWHVKIAMPNVWESKHTLLYKQHYGNIPEGSVVVFKDGNPDNIGVDNIECITRRELALRNANIPKRSESMRMAWKRRKENAKAERRRQLREIYGSLAAAMAAGETL